MEEVRTTMGISKKIWEAQSELDHVNEIIAMDSDDYWEEYIDEKPDMAILKDKKAYLEKELKELSDLGTKFGLVDKA